MGTQTLSVLESTEPIVRASRHVRIDHEAVAALAGRALRSAGDAGAVPRFDPPAWDPRHYRGVDDAETAMYILVQDALNFCFWGDPPWEVSYHGATHRGYWALVAALRRALEVGCPLLDATYLSNLSPDDLEFILRGQGTLPLMKRRLESLQQVGQSLLEGYGGDFTRMIAEAGGGAVVLADRLAEVFPSFDDRVRYGDREIRFLKRAQICVADLHGALGGRGLGAFHDLDRLTAFADYELPRALRELGVLDYSPELAHAVDRKRAIPAGSPEEVELRANTVWAVELLRQALAAEGVRLDAYQLDWILWTWAQEREPSRPPHRTLTIYY